MNSFARSPGRLGLASTVMLLGVALGAQTNAAAATLILNTLGAEEEFQQTTNNPCVIGEPSCQNPAGFPRTIFEPNADEFDGFSPLYLVSQIRTVAGNDFFMGLDINQANGPNNGPQTLSLFQMLINGVVVDTYNTVTLVPPTAGGGNGNGYADYTLTGFTSLSSYNDDATVQFHAVMSGLNDGREQFFLITDTSGGGGGGGGGAVPEPGTLAMLGAAGLAFGIRHFRRVR